MRTIFVYQTRPQLLKGKKKTKKRKSVSQKYLKNVDIIIINDVKVDVVAEAEAQVRRTKDSREKAINSL